MKFKRNLEKDLKLCEAATAGPWQSYHPAEFADDIRISQCGNVDEQVGRGYIGRVTQSHGPQSGGAHGTHLPPRDEDVRLMAEAREGWPATIRYAMQLRAALLNIAARAENLSSADIVAHVADGLGITVKQLQKELDSDADVE